MVSPSLLAAATLAASASPHLQPRQASSNSTLPPGTASLNVSLGDARGDTDEKTLDCNAQQFRYYLTVPNVYVKANKLYLCRLVQRAYFDNDYGRYTTVNQPYHEQLYNETQAINRTMQGDNATQFVFPLYFPGYKYHGWPDHAPGEMGFVVPGVYEIQTTLLNDSAFAADSAPVFKLANFTPSEACHQRLNTDSQTADGAAASLLRAAGPISLVASLEAVLALLCSL